MLKIFIVIYFCWRAAEKILYLRKQSTISCQHTTGCQESKAMLLFFKQRWSNSDFHPVVSVTFLPQITSIKSQSCAEVKSGDHQSHLDLLSSDHKCLFQSVMGIDPVIYVILEWRCSYKIRKLSDLLWKMPLHPHCDIDHWKKLKRSPPNIFTSIMWHACDLVFRCSMHVCMWDCQRKKRGTEER